MAASNSGLKTDVAGSAPAALMSSNTEASQEKVSRAEGTCRADRMSPGRYDTTPNPMTAVVTPDSLPTPPSPYRSPSQLFRGTLHVTGGKPRH